MIELADAILLEVTLCEARATQPHMSRARVRDHWEAARNAGYRPPISNAQVRYERTPLGTPRHDQTTAAIACGWNDVFLGLGVRTEYEAADLPGQRNYEMGRGMAVCAARAGALRPWHPDCSYLDLRERGLVTDEQHEMIMTEHAHHVREVDLTANKEVSS